MRERVRVISDLKNAVESERRSAVQVLHLLREVERDRHHLEMGYPSLFEFATRELGYSVGAAHRRIQSMRLLKEMPEIEGKIESGELSLCVASKTQSFFRHEDQRRKEEGEERLSREAKRRLVQSMFGSSTRDCERKLAKISPESALPPERVRPIAEGKNLVQFVADTDLMEKLEKLQALLAHQNREGRIDGLIEILADLALKNLEKKTGSKEKENSLPAVETAAPQLEGPVRKPRSRHIPLSVRRAVWKRDGGCCTYSDSQSGRRCSSRYALQFDHIRPYALGGTTDEKNLRLRCASHNRFTAEKQGLIRVQVTGPG